MALLTSSCYNNCCLLRPWQRRTMLWYGGASSSHAMVSDDHVSHPTPPTETLPSHTSTTGKGMHDGAGAWLKSAAARAVLSGVGIASVQDFFHFCVDTLHSNTSHKNFTSQRFFYIVDVTTSALYRATMCAKVTASLNIKFTSKSKDRTGHT